VDVTKPQKKRTKENLEKSTAGGRQAAAQNRAEDEVKASCSFGVEK